MAIPTTFLPFVTSSPLRDWRSSRSQALVDALRSGGWLTELSRYAELNPAGEIIGHVAYSPVKIEGSAQIAFPPRPAFWPSTQRTLATPSPIGSAGTHPVRRLRVDRCELPAAMAMMPVGPETTLLSPLKSLPRNADAARRSAATPVLKELSSGKRSRVARRGQHQDFAGPILTRRRPSSSSASPPVDVIRGSVLTTRSFRPAFGSGDAAHFERRFRREVVQLLELPLICPGALPGSTKTLPDCQPRVVTSAGETTMLGVAGVTPRVAVELVDQSAALLTVDAVFARIVRLDVSPVSGTDSWRCHVCTVALPLIVKRIVARDAYVEQHAGAGEQILTAPLVRNHARSTHCSPR